MEGIAASRLGQPQFDDLARRHRLEVELHCYRMLGSAHDAEDAVQEALLRAWRSRGQLSDRARFRPWLYRIATNVCLRALERRAAGEQFLPQQLAPAIGFEPLGAAAGGAGWLEPFPVSALDLVRDASPGPAARVEARESVRLAFVAAIQLLPPRQRAILLLRDVLGLTAAEAAEALGTTPAAANSALERARQALGATRRALGTEPRPALEADQRALLDQFVRAWEAADVDGLVAMLADDAAWSMPPWPQWYLGRSPIAAFLRWAWRDGPGTARLLPAWANGQPAFGYYRRGHAESAWRPFAIVVPDLAGTSVGAIASFVDPSLFARFGLPEQPGPHVDR